MDMGIEKSVVYVITARLPGHLDHDSARSLGKKHGVEFDPNCLLGYRGKEPIIGPAFVGKISGGFIGIPDVEELLGRINEALKEE